MGMAGIHSMEAGLWELVQVLHALWVLECSRNLLELKVDS
jgi:hypothetical protein